MKILGKTFKQFVSYKNKQIKQLVRKLDKVK